MSIYDPPADPYGDEKHCPICDGLMEPEPFGKEWFCPNNHDEEEGK